MTFLLYIIHNHYIIIGKQFKVFKSTIQTVPVYANEGTLIIVKFFEIFFIPNSVIFPTKYKFGNYSSTNGSDYN